MRRVLLWLLLPLASCLVTTEPGIIYPRMLSSRSDTGEKVVKLNDDITLNLRKSTIFPEEFLVYTSADETPARYLMKGEDAEANLYHDVKYMASLDVSDEDGLEILGAMGPTLRIKPMPDMERSADGQKAHMLYHDEEPEFLRDKFHDDIGDPRKFDNTTSALERDELDSSEPDSLQGSSLVESRRLQQPHHTHTRLPLTIYPEVHIVADYLYCQAYNFDMKSIVTSIAIAGNAVNLRYRSLRFPRVQIRIVGVSITKTLKEEPYMVYVRGYEATRNILYEHTLWNFTVYTRQQDYFKTSDVVFLLTGRNLSEWKGSELVSWVGGYAYPATACTLWKVGMSEERPRSFHGIYTMAHELAHVLGCMHDGGAPRGWPAGIIGSEDCPWKDGYLMSYEFIIPYVYSFSSCCSREIMNFYNRPNYTCLSIRNSKRKPIYSPKLPGYKIDYDMFCNKVYPGYRYIKAATHNHVPANCLLTCYTSRDKTESKLAYVADGMSCGGGNVCILGNCTTKPTIRRPEPDEQAE
uniref:Reprolysin n=1 Tax=Rhipicephalus appendiculatus TaxID=34631 RepID=A0A131YX29_RHIAP